MYQQQSIQALLKSGNVGSSTRVQGWVRTFRNNQFIALNDGSGQSSLQVVVPLGKFEPALIDQISTGAALIVEGILQESQGKGQRVELMAEHIEVTGLCDPATYPLQPKKHSMEFLREIAHLRFRTNTFGAVFRMRHHVSWAIHEFFHKNGFYYLHSPIITASDAEGAGEMFHVTTFGDTPPRKEDGSIDYQKDFFGRATNLTVSGQLEAELGALALGKVYTFGPTFRAENSNTPRHLAEFWMIEPEVAFADLQVDMQLAEDMLKYIIRHCLDACAEDLDFLDQRFAEEERNKPQAERSSMTLKERLEFVIKNPFQRCTYTEAIEILKSSPPNKKGKFQYPVEKWGMDLQSEHERYLVEKHFNTPVILYNYPKDIKAFYMRLNDDGNTVAAMDILFPGIGEMVGGSQREERLDVLLHRMREMHIPEKELYWYTDIRKYGGCPHAGFGLGFERMLMFVTGMTNIRDVIPFPRFPGNAEF